MAASLAGFYLGHFSGDPGASTAKAPPSALESTTGMASLDAAPGAGAPSSEPSLAPFTLTPQRIQSIGVKTGVVERRQVQDEIRTVGNVAADETRLADVQVRFSGWVQKVYADAMFKVVRQGQPLLTVYSPELVTAEQDYLVAKQLLALSGRAEVAGWPSLLNASAERLKVLQILLHQSQQLDIKELQALYASLKAGVVQQAVGKLQQTVARGSDIANVFARERRQRAGDLLDMVGLAPQAGHDLTLRAHRRSETPTPPIWAASSPDNSRARTSTSRRSSGR